jgi:hypothetical protein
MSDKVYDYDAFLKFLESWSGYNNYLKDNFIAKGDEKDPL